MTTARPTLIAALALLLALAVPLPGHATNGMYLTGYGAETAGRGGADLAVSDRTLGLNFNPAGISQLQTGLEFAAVVYDMRGLKQFLDEHHPTVQRTWVKEKPTPGRPR